MLIWPASTTLCQVSFFKTPLSNFRPVFQSGSSFNVQTRPLFKLALNKKQQEFSHKLPRYKHYQMRSVGSNSLGGFLSFSDNILFKFFFVLALGNCLRELEQTPQTDSRRKRNTNLFPAVHSSLSTF